MLKEWMRGSPSETAAKPEEKKAAGRMVVDPEKAAESHEVAAERRREAYEKKLAETLKEGPPTPGKAVTYDTLFRKAQTVLMAGNAEEIQEGVTLNIGRNVQNTMISSKWCLVNPEMSHWEVNLQMNGFSDIIAASWNTKNSQQLMYQRVSSTGAMLVTQFMCMRQGGMSQNTVFALMQYPWKFGACTQVQYVKDRSFEINHVQRLIRGVQLGTKLSYDPATHASFLSYASSFMTPKKDAGFSFEMTPSKGTWKLAATSFDWGQNMDAGIEVEYKEGREGMESAINIGCRKHFVGGAQLTTALQGFNLLKMRLELPFGGEHQGMNQFRMSMGCQYDIHSGALKQGLTFTT